MFGCRQTDARAIPKVQPGGANQARIAPGVCEFESALERRIDLAWRELAHSHSHRAITQITGFIERRGRLAHDSWRIDIHGIGNQSGRRIGRRGICRQHSDRIGDTQRSTATRPAAGGDAANAVAGMQPDHVLRPGPREMGTHADPAVAARRKMNRNIATVVDQHTPHTHGLDNGQQMIGHRTGDGRHGRDEALR